MLLAGCFVDGAVGGAITPHAPAPPSADGAYLRGGVGLGWGSHVGTLQASGDVMQVGDVAAIGGAVQAAVFIVPERDEVGAEGWCVMTRGFLGTGIGDSASTAELSIGGGYAFWAHKDLDFVFDNMALMLSAYRTTFDDRGPMWSYGLNLSITLDPVVVGKAILGKTSE